MELFYWVLHCWKCKQYGRCVTQRCQIIVSLFPVWTQTWDVHYCTFPPSQFIQSHCCQFCCHCQCSSLCHVSWSYILTVSIATLHAKKSKMTCIAGCLQHFHLSLVISIGKSWGIAFFFQVTNHVKTQFQAFQRLKDKGEKLESSRSLI